MKWIIISVFIMTGGCKNTESAKQTPQSDVPFEVLLSGHQSNVEEPVEEIITTTDRLKEVYATINSSRYPALPVPEVDFTKESVAFVNMGMKTTGGYSVSVGRVEQSQGSCKIMVESTSPGAGDNVTMVITQPFTLVKFARQDIPVVFQKKLE